VLPSFDGALRPREAELLLQYLTVPYLRVPLLLRFFAQPSHLHALGSVKLQAALDAALFEPGLWQAEPHKRLPRQIPGPDRAHLATPAGVLFNELVMSPHAVTEPVLKLVVLAMELDSGRYSAGSANCSALLYVLRVAVRVEGFVRVVLAAHDAQEAAASGAGRPGDCPARGLGARPKELANLRACAVRLRGALQHDLHPVVEQAEHAPPPL